MGSFPSLKRQWIAASESQRIERILAATRALLAVASLFVVWVDPTEPRHYASVVYGLLALFVLEAVGVLALVRTQRTSSPQFRLAVHSLDILWPALIAIFTAGPNSPFYLFYTFVLLEAAYRWGLRATLVTALVSTALFICQSFFTLAKGLTVTSLFSGSYDLNSFVMRGVYLLIMGYLLGYLGEEEKQLRVETAAIAKVMTKARAEVGVRGTIEAVFDEILDLWPTRQAVMAVLDHNSGRAFLWNIERQESKKKVNLSIRELHTREGKESLFETPGHVWHAYQSRTYGSTKKYKIYSLDEDGRRLFDEVWAPPAELAGNTEIHSCLGVRALYGDEWSSVMLLLEPELRATPESAVRFMRTLALQVTPAIYTSFLTSRLRSRAGALERARVARELHDGVIQSLIGIEMEIDVLRRQTDASPAAVVERLSHIQKILRQEVLNLRELMQQMKPIDIRPTQLLDFLVSMVDKFKRDTGISSRFVSTLQEISLTPRVCNQLARIVQEGLFNARKHSGASTVLVQLGQQDGRLRLVIDDDGRGFDFSGRLDLAELDAIRKGPLVIKERVRTIGAELVVESIPGKGSRIEVSLPKNTYG
ncbi:MAG: sensor histidine kinase [Acidobacteria bacterium]|nr:sensor histidine kinase [Acidobacteriota bacterium]